MALVPSPSAFFLIVAFFFNISSCFSWRYLYWQSNLGLAHFCIQLKICLLRSRLNTGCVMYECFKKSVMGQNQVPVGSIWLQDHMSSLSLDKTFS